MDTTEKTGKDVKALKRERGTTKACYSSSRIHQLPHGGRPNASRLGPSPIGPGQLGPVSQSIGRPGPIGDGPNRLEPGRPYRRGEGKA